MATIILLEIRMPINIQRNIFSEKERVAEFLTN